MALNAHVMKTKTLTCAFAAMVLLAHAALAGVQDRNALSSRTTKYGTPGKIEVTVMPNPKKEMILLFDNGRDKKIREIKIAAGKGLKRMDLTCYKKWSLTLTLDGEEVDRETAMQKTGMQTRVRL